MMMRRRADRLMGVTRLHTPTVDEPLIVLLVDEIRRAHRLDQRPDHQKADRLSARRCCWPRAAPSASSWSAPCKTPART